MSKVLRMLIGAKEPLFSTTLRQLEHMAGNRGIDIAYLADVTARAHSCMRRIGLDPRDTTPTELYRALVSRARDTKLFADTYDVGLVIDNQVVSFNRDDLLETVKKPFAERATSHMQCQVLHTLSDRYTTARPQHAEVIVQLLGQAGMDSCPMDDYHKRIKAHGDARPSILCVGDVFSDVFIKLSEREAKVETDKDGNEWLSVPFGSKPPYEEAQVVHSVGPSPNAAVSCARLGLDVGLMSWIGDDEVGRETRKYLTGEQIDTRSMQVQRGLASSTYYVLRYGADRTILVKDEPYDYTWHAPSMPPDWVYLSLISANSWKLHQDMMKYLDEHPHVKLAFQPGTFHFKWGVHKLAKVYRRAEIVVMNREEAADVTGRPKDSIAVLADGLHQLGPRYVVITDGPHGSYASYDNTLVTVPNYPDPAPPLDRTGAGDAFASTIVAALARGESIETALLWAPINSMNVVQKLGAQAGLLPYKTIQKYLAEAPEWYAVKEYT